MTDEQTLYDDAVFYDVVHGDRATTQALKFYGKQIALYGSPVLELASGAGAYMVPFTEQGIAISGIDISDEMMARAGEKAAARNVSLDVRKADIRDFELNRKFPLILILGNSLQHLNTREDVEKCFNSVKKHLAPNGRFIIEVFNPSVQILARKPSENVLDSVYETREGKMSLIGRVDYDEATQINHIVWDYQNVSTGATKQFFFTMRQFFPQELDALLAYNGFRIEEKYGSWEGEIFGKGSPKQIVVASLI